MKKLGLVLLLVAALAPSAQAGIIDGDFIRVTGTLGSAATRGGAFLVDGPASNDFLTFCVERSETFSYNSSYQVNVETVANQGGGGSNPDPLDSRTAYLYANYLAGSFGPMTMDQIDGLQLAIWRIEQEVDNTYSGVGSPTSRGLATTYFNLANSNANGGLYGIQVMQLWDSYNTTTNVGTGYHQDLLVRVPDGGTTLALLGCALMGLGALHRKFGR